MRSLRQWHHYIGVFFAPMIVFLAFTGALQVFSLHEAKGYGGQPAPGWIAWMASVHKDQAPPRQKRSDVPKSIERPAAVVAMPAGGHGDENHATNGGKHPSPLPLKIFMLLLAVSLIFSTSLGVTIALNNRSMRSRSLALLMAGAVIPCLLLWV
ncbi:MAG: hypothetical protein ABIS14_02395 [Sphingomonas sp.]